MKDLTVDKIPLSAVVITKNEEANIAKCLASARRADEGIVVDDESADKTRAIAEKYADKVITKKMDIEGSHRNYAYSLAGNKWVLSLDADEVISDELWAELSGLLKTDIKHWAFTIPIRTYIGNHWIRHGGWYPAGKVRLFRKDRFKYEEAEVHPRAFFVGGEGTCGHLTGDIVHYSYRDLHDFFTSLNNQTTLEAKKWFKERRRIGFPRMVKKFCTRFVKSYFFKQGFKDGLIGFVAAYGSSLYQFMSYAKYRFMLRESNEAQTSVEHYARRKSAGRI